VELTKEQRYQFLLVFLSVIFLIIYNFNNITVWWPKWMQFEHLIFNWPDATANHFFASSYANTRLLFVYEPLNLITNNLLHARSVNVLEGSLVPMAFLPSIVVFSLFYKILGAYGVLFITPLMAMFSAWLVYRLVLYLFKDLDIAFISTLLFLSLAPWVFFANVVMVPTVMFVFLVLGGWWAIVKSFKSKHELWWILGSFLLSLAVVVRPTEVVWLALISLFVLYIKRDILSAKKIVFGLLVLVAVLFGFFSLNKATYGGYFTFGYLNLQSGQVDSEIQLQSRGIFSYIKLLIAPFGFNFVLILKNFYKYYIDIILPHFVLAVAGFVLLISKYKKRSLAWKKYLLISPFIFILILLYYASWNLADPLVKELNTISISYVRYFMPLYIWILPLVALAIKELFMGSSTTNKIASYVVVSIIVVSSLKLAFMSEHDGLLENRKTLNNYYAQYERVSSLVEDDAVIISERSDKVFFPKYRVIAFQGDLPLWERVKNIVDVVPVYYYSNESEEKIQVDRQAANELNLDLAEPSQIWDNFILYKVQKMP